LEEYGKNLSDLGLPEPIIHTRKVVHKLAQWGSNPSELADCADCAVEILKPEQRAIYEYALTTALNGSPLCLFVDGKAGRGKTMLVNTLCDRLRSLGRIVCQRPLLPMLHNCIQGEEQPTLHSSSVHVFQGA
jgi:predicted ATPase